MPFDLGSLIAPERNLYFYGMLMDAERFQKDQDYFISRLDGLNRFVTGAGVVCGLGLAFDAAKGALTLCPGIAIDFVGREIIVPVATRIDTAHLTDDHGHPNAPVPGGATILISIAYSERKTDPIAVLVADCDHPNGCAPSTIREGFKILVKLATGAAPAPPGDTGLLPATDAALQAKIADMVAKRGGPAPADTSVALGRLSLPGGPLDAVSDRPVIFSNTLLYQLVASLAAEVARMNPVVLSYVSGDNQSAKQGVALANPLVVALVDQGGAPALGGAAPQFTVSAGGGSVGPVTPAGPPGQYQATWTLGPPGPQTLTAQSASSALTVTFNATIEP